MHGEKIQQFYRTNPPLLRNQNQVTRNPKHTEQTTHYINIWSLLWYSYTFYYGRQIGTNITNIGRYSNIMANQNVNTHSQTPNTQKNWCETIRYNLLIWYLHYVTDHMDHILWSMWCWQSALEYSRQTRNRYDNSIYIHRSLYLFNISIVYYIRIYSMQLYSIIVLEKKIVNNYIYIVRIVFLHSNTHTEKPNYGTILFHRSDTEQIKHSIRMTKPIHER